MRDEELKAEICRVHRSNYGVYGVEKVWRQLNRQGITVGRDQVGRLMRSLGLAGVVRGKRARTTVPSDAGARPADLVDRKFTAPAPNRLWVPDLTYVSTGPASPMWPLLWTSSAATSWAGGCRPRCERSWLWTR